MDNNNVKTLCIPRSKLDITEPFVRNIFNSLNIGVIGRIDLIKKQNEKGGQQFMRIFVHIIKWYNTENAFIAKERLFNGKDIKIIYDDPWFWKVSVYKAPVSNYTSSSSDCPPVCNYAYNYGNNDNLKKEDNLKKDDNLKKEDNTQKIDSFGNDDDNWRKPRRK